MRVIVDENITHSVIQGLRDRGYDVLSVKESMRGVDDTSILQRAEAEQRLVVTQDKDFGELASNTGCLRRVGLCCSGCPPTTQPTTINACWT